MTTLSATIVHSFQNNNAVASNSKSNKNKRTFAKAFNNYLNTVTKRIYEARMEEVKMRAYYRF